MQFEVKPYGVPYTNTNTVGSQVDGNAGGFLLQLQAPSSLGYGSIPHFRARLLFKPSSSPPWSLQTPWRHGGVLGDALGGAVRLTP